MDITKQKLIDMRACAPGIDTFDKQFPNGATLNDAVEWCISTEGEDNLQYASWLLTHLFDKPQAVKYAVFAAEQVIELFEKKYPSDARPRKAIEAAKAWLGNPCDDTKNAAAAAAAATYATYDAAYAAAYDAAAYAAAAATSAAAAAAAYDAAAAAAAAYAAAYDDAAAAYATYAAARLKMKTKILRYGVTLFN